MPQLPVSCLVAHLTELLGPMSVWDSILTVLLSKALQPSPSCSKHPLQHSLGCPSLLLRQRGPQHCRASDRSQAIFIRQHSTSVHCCHCSLSC